MSDLEDLQAQLLNHTHQLQSTNKLLQKDPDNETLQSLKTDTEALINLTKKLIETKTKKSRAGRAAASSSESTEEKGGDEAGQEPKAVQETLVMKKIPREWGVYKNDWIVGERCQVKHSEDNMWYIAEITDINHATRGATLELLDAGVEYSASLGELRTYVAPLREEVKAGQAVRAMWAEDGHFYDANVEKLNEDGTFDVTFTKYEEQGTVPLNDIQLKKVKKRKRDEELLVDESGKVTEKFEIPDYLKYDKEEHDDSKRRKRKKIKELKVKHKSLLRDQKLAGQQSSWQKFHKGKKSKRSKFEKNRDSIFKSKKNGPVDIHTQPDNKTMTHYTKHQNYHHLRMDPNAAI